MAPGLSLDEIADLAGGEVVGDPERRVGAVRSLERAGPDDLAFVTSERLRTAASATRAGALLAPRSMAGLVTNGVVCDDPGLAIVAVLEALHPAPGRTPGIHPTAVVGEGTTVDASASIGPHAVLGEGCEVAAEVTISAGCVVGDDCSIGPRTVLHPRVVLYRGTRVGEDVIVHAGAVIGSDGFGYASSTRGPVKVPQVGRVVIEDRVEIGANTTIDRATLEETRIGADSKLDNLVQVGHNVELGRACILCGQSGVAGSTKLGSGVVLGGQAGVADHVTLGDGVQVAARSAVLQPVAEGRTVAGTPAIDLPEWRRQSSALRRLGEMLRRLRKLEKRFESEGDDDGDHA